MGTESDWLNHDHRAFEALLARCEEAAEREDWKSVKQLFNDLVGHLKAHMQMEEEVLYPAYESLTDAPEGPTVALRAEHDEIVRLVRDLSLVLNTNNSDLFLDALLPLDKTLAGHHQKEEEIFLPMAGHALREKREQITAKLKQLDQGKSMRKWEL